jgi:hypothetical protein
MNIKNNKDKEQRRFLATKIGFSITSLVIAGFYSVSAMGWFVATYAMARTGQLGNEGTKFYQSLNIMDHVIRSGQVVLIVIASFALLLFRKIAMVCFLSALPLV